MIVAEAKVVVNASLESIWNKLVDHTTWPAWDTYVTECYAVLSPDWYNADGLAPSGFDVAGLRAALAALGGGRLPDGPTPPPVDPPAPVPGDRWEIPVPAALAGRKLKNVTLEFEKA